MSNGMELTNTDSINADRTATTIISIRKNQPSLYKDPDPVFSISRFILRAVF